MRKGKFQKFNDKRFQIRLLEEEFEDWKHAAEPGYRVPLYLHKERLLSMLIQD